MPTTHSPLNRGARTAERDVSREALGARAPHEVAPDIAYLRTAIVNVYFVGAPGAPDGEWVLVDAGMPGFAGRIARAAAARFGESRPAAIVLTHGHFDHVGAVRELAERWDVPVYAHRLELPYLTGRSAYPPPDPTVGGGAMARLSMLYPRGPIDLGRRVRLLPDDRAAIPGMPGWRWIHTPGHTPGHVSFVREADRALIAGDAFVTTKQESAIAALTQRPEVHGPPAYYTPDWISARSSVEELAALEPTLAATGHGVPLRGDAMRRALHDLARDFGRLAVPRRGRYVRRRAIADERGVVVVPPPVADPLPKIVLGVAAVALTGAAVAAWKRRETKQLTSNA